MIKDWLKYTQTEQLSLIKSKKWARSALERVIAEDIIKGRVTTGFAEALTVFSEQHKEWGECSVPEDDWVTRKKRL